MSIICDVARLHIVIHKQLLNISIFAILPRIMSRVKRPKHLCEPSSRFSVVLSFDHLMRYTLFVLPTVINVYRLIPAPLAQRLCEFDLI